MLAMIKCVGRRVLVKLILLMLLDINVAVFAANNISVHKLIITLTLYVNF